MIRKIRKYNKKSRYENLSKFRNDGLIFLNSKNNFENSKKQKYLYFEKSMNLFEMKKVVYCLLGNYFYFTFKNDVRFFWDRTSVARVRAA